MAPNRPVDRPVDLEITRSYTTALAIVTACSAQFRNFIRFVLNSIDFDPSYELPTLGISGVP